MLDTVWPRRSKTKYCPSGACWKAAGSPKRPTRCGGNPTTGCSVSGWPPGPGTRSCAPRLAARTRPAAAWCRGRPPIRYNFLLSTVFAPPGRRPGSPAGSRGYSQPVWQFPRSPSGEIDRRVQCARTGRSVRRPRADRYRLRRVRRTEPSSDPATADHHLSCQQSDAGQSAASRPRSTTTCPSRKTDRRRSPSPVRLRRDRRLPSATPTSRAPPPTRWPARAPAASSCR